MDKDDALLEKEMDETFYGANKAVIPKKERHKARGRGKISSKLKVKQINVIEEQQQKQNNAIKEKEKEDKNAKKNSANKKGHNSDPSVSEVPVKIAPYNPLNRFMK